MAITITYSVTPTKTAAYTAGWGEMVLCNPSGGAFSITLSPAASASGRQCIIKNTTTSTVSIVVDGNASETIDGSATYIMNIGKQSVTIISDGSNCWVV